MSIVARGLGTPGGLLVTYGLGDTAPSLIILCPIEQETAVLEILQTIDFSEYDVRGLVAEINLNAIAAEIITKVDAETQVIVVEAVDEKC